MESSLGLFGAGLICAGLGFGLSAASYAYEQGKYIDAKWRAIHAQEWSKLITKNVLKQADPDLKTYLLKEQEYALIVRDFQSLVDSTLKKMNIIQP